MGAELGDETLKDIAKILVDVEYASSEKEADDAVANGLLDHGTTFIRLASQLAGQPGQESADITDRIASVSKRWLVGDEISNRADEPELRARFALEVMEMEPMLARLAAGAVLRLPEGHPVRDEARVKTALLEMLEDSGISAADGNDPPASLGTALNAIAGLVTHRLVADAERIDLIERGLGWLPTDDSGNISGPFRQSAATDFIGRAIDARDGDNQAEQRRWLKRARSAYQPILDYAAGAGKSDPKDELIVAFLENLEREAGIPVEPDARKSEPISDVSSLTRHEMIVAAFTADMESSAAYDEQDYTRVARVLWPFISWCEERYITAVSPERIEDAGKRFSDIMTRLAFTQAHRDNWDSAVRLLDAMKSRRFRYQAALRRGASQDRVIELEDALRKRAWDAEGLSENDAETVQRTKEARILEEYRRLRESSPAALADLRIRDLSRKLPTGDALLVFGMSHYGVMIFVIRRGDRAKPSLCSILPPSTADEVKQAVIAWIVSLASPSADNDSHMALPTLLSDIDSLLGIHVAPFLAENNIRHLTVVPHGVLHFVPFWALPSLDAMQVEVVPSAADFVEACAPFYAPLKDSVVVSNPTLDLPLAELEGEVVSDILTGASMDVTHLQGRKATRQAIEAAGTSPWLLHFAGHGRGDVIHPLDSALELNLDERHSADLKHLLLTDGNPDWREPTGGERSTEISGVGHLTEFASPGTSRIERCLQRSDGTTLAALFRYIEGKQAGTNSDAGLSGQAHDSNEDSSSLADVSIRESSRRWKAMEKTLADGSAFDVELIRSTELWTAGDILSYRSLSDCAIVFLSSCETAMGQLRTNTDESAGFAAALQLAGAAAVISPMWPVDTVVAILYAELFYDALMHRLNAKRSGRIIDLGEIVHHTRQALRQMTSDEAAGHLKKRASRTKDPMTQLLLEAEATRMQAQGPYPFEHAADWAAFHILGAKRYARRPSLLQRITAAINRPSRLFTRRH